MEKIILLTIFLYKLLFNDVTDVFKQLDLVICLIKLNQFCIFCMRTSWFNNQWFSFVCSMGGLVVKQILYKAKEEGFDNLVKNTIGIVCFHY